LQAFKIEDSLSFRVGGQQYLKTAVQQKPVEFVSTSATADGFGGFEDLARQSFLSKLASTA
jgi:hypothetical protein